MRTINTSPTLKKWIWLNFEIGALSFGGSGRVLLYRDAVVDRWNWLSADEFQEIFTLAQVLPGPNLVNVGAYLGYRLLGPLATVLGTLALAIPGVVLALGITMISRFEDPNSLKVFQGFVLGSMALFLILIIKLIPGIQRTSSMKTTANALIALAVMAASLLSLPLIPVIVTGFALGIVVEFAL